MNQIDNERSESREPGFSTDTKDNRRTRHGSDVEREHTASSEGDEERTFFEDTFNRLTEATPPVDETGPDSLQDVEQPED